MKNIMFVLFAFLVASPVYAQSHRDVVYPNNINREQSQKKTVTLKICIVKDKCAMVDTRALHSESPKPVSR